MNKHTKEIELMYEIGIFLRDLLDAFKFFALVIIPVTLACIVLEWLCR